MNRFELFANSQYIKDNVTGFQYSSLQEICKLLNNVNKRADRNADELWKFRELMMKYEIDSVEKLDQVLFNQKVW